MSDWKPETWKLCGNHNYEVSSLGRVRKVNSQTFCGMWPNQDGYMLVRFSHPRSVERVHRLVAIAFLENPTSKPTINHIDCDPSNNRAENLEWCTQKENLQHSAKLGRMQKDYWKGRRSPNAKLMNEEVALIRGMYACGEGSWESLALLFGVSKRCIGRVIRREVYRDVA